MTTNTEKKFVTLDLKTVSEEGEFEGYASKFGDRDQGGDIVMKGAFTQSLSRKASPRAVKMLWQHDPSSPIGVWDEIKEDASGLYVKGRLLTSLSKGKEVYDMMKAGIIDGLSIGYRTVRATKNKSGFRELMELDLWEISCVTFPMLQSATITSVKGEWGKRDVERVLRDAGMPNAMATKLIAGGWDAANTGGQGDPANGLSDVAESIRRMNETLQRRV